MVTSGKRTAAHLLRVPNATSIGNGARHLAALADGDRWGMPRFPKITTPEIVETVQAWPELSRYVTGAHAAFTQAGIPVGAHCAVLAQASRSDLIGVHDVIQQWLEGVRTGANLSDRDPRHEERQGPRALHARAGLPQAAGRPGFLPRRRPGRSRGPDSKDDSAPEISLRWEAAISPEPGSYERLLEILFTPQSGDAAA